MNDQIEIDAQAGGIILGRAGAGARQVRPQEQQPEREVPDAEKKQQGGQQQRH